MTKEILNRSEAAEFLGISVPTLDRDRKKRHLGIPYEQRTVGQTKVSYRRSELQQWKKSVTKNSTTPGEIK